jgi:hypothetical protein
MRLAAQLAAPTWKPRGDKILIESKDSKTSDAESFVALGNHGHCSSHDCKRGGGGYCWCELRWRADGS